MSSSPSDVCIQFQCAFCVVIAFVILVWIANEIDSHYGIKAMNYIQQNAILLPDGEAGVEELSQNPGKYKDQLVYLCGVEVSPVTELRDDDVGLVFENSATVRRITEYCQWKEIQVDLTKYDEDRYYYDYPRDKNSSWKYEYSIDWRPRLINSDDFENMEFANIDRNPFPSYYHSSETFIGKSRFLQTENELDTGEFLGYKIPKDSKLTKFAVQNGVVEHDSHWIYSDYVSVGTKISIPWFQSKTYYVQRNYYTRGQCSAGDIRVKYMEKKYPRLMSIAAKFDGGRKLEGFKYFGASDYFMDQLSVFSVAGSEDLHEHVREISSQKRWQVWIARFVLVTSLLLFSLSCCACIRMNSR